MRAISGRAQAEEALRESEERYRMLFDRVPVGLYRTTPEGDILDANPALVQMLGYPDLQSLLAVKATDLYEYPERRVRVQALTEQGEILRGHELQIRRLDGTTIWVRDTARVIRDSDGQIAYYEGSLENISKRRQTDELLQGLNLAALGMETALTDEEVFTAAGEELKNLGFTSAVLLKDESGSRLVLRYLGTESRALEAAERLVGISYRGISFPIDAVPRLRDAMLGKAIFGDWDLESVRQALPVAAKPLASQIQKLMALSRAITVPLIVEDEVIGLLSVQSNDLTQENVPAITAFANQMAAALRKANLFRELQDSLEKLQRTQAQLLQSQKMEAVGTLAGGVAHDFNNILTAIAGFGQLVRDELAPDDARRVDVEEILKASERAASLTRQLLAFSRRQRLQMQILDLNELVANTEKMLRRLIGEDIHLTTVLEERLARVRADPGQMEQVIMNLAVNAHDAMPSGGQLVIKTENVALDRAQSSLIPEARPGQFVRLTVSDTGMGMDEETLKHAFEPFFTTKGPGKGTGLGLPVVYGIAAQHEGWVNILTGVGEGSTFEIYLPAFPLESEGEPEDEDQPEPLGEGQRILLVEDDAGVRGVAARVLRQGGYTVLEASTMEEAVQVFEQQQGKIDLLFSDVVLPSSNGLELADQLLSRKADLRVLLASGYAGDKSRWAAIVERGFAFIQKPYLVPELLRAVAEALDDGVATG
jgi:PAS domain S-box-containing protein